MAGSRSASLSRRHREDRNFTRPFPPAPLLVVQGLDARLRAHVLISARRMPRVTNRYGCVTLHSYHFSVEEGLPQTQGLLWVAGEQLRAVCENVVWT
jgi:hypothetical protein